MSSSTLLSEPLNSNPRAFCPLQLELSMALIALFSSALNLPGLLDVWSVVSASSRNSIPFVCESAFSLGGAEYADCPDPLLNLIVHERGSSTLG